jgi:RNA polymerase sigma-B factor
MFTIDVEQRLLERYQRDGDHEARQELIRRFVPLAKGLAARYASAGNLEDLQQVACVGLIKALDRFDPERGSSFRAYAAPTILGELKRHFRDSSWSVRVPRGLQENALRVNAAMERLVAREGRSPTPKEVARECGLSVEQVLEAAEAERAHRTLALDAAPPEEGALAPIEKIGVREEGYRHAESALAMKPAVAELSEQDRRILALRLGPGLTQAQIGARLGVSQMHVSRRLRLSLEALSQAMEA